MKTSLYKKIKSGFIVNVRQFIFSLNDRFPLIGRPLVICWRLFDDLKFIIEKKTIQLKAGPGSGDDKLKRELAVFFKGKKAYQSFLPSSLSDIPFLREGEPRLKMIKENLSVRSGTLLDIGSNLGYFCHKFEDERFDCYAVEENRILSYFAEKIKKVENKKFKVISESIFEYKKNQDLSFDVILALSIFHNFLARKDLYLNLIKLLKRLRAKEMFFETYIPTGNYYKDYTPDEFVSFIINNSCFNKAELIGKSGEEKLLYKLTP